MDDRNIEISATLNPDVAWQLAQLCKRIGFADAYELTEAHLPRAERERLAYQMLAGVDAVAAGLSRAGVSPR